AAAWPCTGSGGWRIPAHQSRRARRFACGGCEDCASRWNMHLLRQYRRRNRYSRIQDCGRIEDYAMPALAIVIVIVVLFVLSAIKVMAEYSAPWCSVWDVCWARP